jgi:hypothetical protein
VRDGWSRDPDGILRIPKLKAFQIFGALKHDHGHVPDFALNLVVSRGMGFEEFLDVNSIEFAEAS